MLAVYVALLTLGVVLAVPAMVRAVERLPSPAVADAAGIGALLAGGVGLLARQTAATDLATLIAAVAFGVAGAVTAPELLARIRSRPEAPYDPAHDAMAAD